MTLAQCVATAGYICPTPASKPPIIVKSAIQGVVDPCSVIVPPEAPPSDELSVKQFAFDGLMMPIEAGIDVMPSFTACYNGTPTEVRLKDNLGNPEVVIPLPAESFTSPYTYNLSAPGNVIFTLCATDGVTTVDQTLVMMAQCRQYIGWTDNAGPYTAADILGLSELTTNVTPDGTFSTVLSPNDGAGGVAGTGSYVVHVYCDSLGPRDMFDYSIGGMFTGGFDEVQTGLVINGVTYRVARTNLRQYYPAGALYVGT